MIIEFVLNNWTVIAGMISFIAMALGGIATWMGKRASARLDAQSTRFSELNTAFEAQQGIIDTQKETLKYLGQRVQELEEAHARDFAAMEEQRREISRLTTEVEDLTRWGVRVIDVLEEAKIVVPEPPPPLQRKKPRKGPRL